MKKILMVVAIMAMFAFSFSAFAMTPVADSDLSTVTGQAGVSINLDVRVDLIAETLAWGDADGFTANNVTVTNGSNSNAGWVGLSNLTVENLRIRADQVMLAGDFVKKKAENAGTAYGGYLLANNPPPLGLSNGFNPADPLHWSANDIGVLIAANNPTYSGVVGQFAGAFAQYGSQATTLLTEIGTNQFTPFAPLTIDVATGTGANGLRGDHGSGVTYVRIGTGSLEVSMQTMKANVELGPDTNFPNAAVAGTPDLKYQLGSLSLNGLGLRIGGNSYIDIFNKRTSTGNLQGVNIYANLTVKDFAIKELAWGDADGIDWNFSYQTGDTAGTTKLHTNDTALQTTDAGDPVTDGAGWVGLKNLNISRIDVAGEVAIDVATVNNFSFVQIGLGNTQAEGMNINLSGLTATAALGNAPGSWSGAPATFTSGLTQELGEIYMSGANVTVWGGLQLGARVGSQGITIDLKDISVAIADDLTVSWGDKDGIDGVADAGGYVGLIGLNINGLKLKGQISIDVATIDEGSPSSAATIEDMMYLGYRENNLSPTIVHIGLGTGNANDDALTSAFAFTPGAATFGIEILNLGGSVAFDSVYDLATPNVMGMIYASGIKVGINGWVDIGAH